MVSGHDNRSRRREIMHVFSLPQKAETLFKQKGFSLKKSQSPTPISYFLQLGELSQRFQNVPNY